MTLPEVFVIDHQLLSYLILFAGMLIEGDVVYITAAIFASQKHLNWGLVVAIGFIGMLAGDIGFYYLGRFSRATKLGNWFTRRFSRYHAWLDKNFVEHYAVFVFFAKFLYYVNRIGPFLAGWHTMGVRRFMKLHFYATVFWLVVMTTLGVLFGALVELLGARWLFDRLWLVVLGLLVMLILGERVVRKIFKKKIETTE